MQYSIILKMPNIICAMHEFILYISFIYQIMYVYLYWILYMLYHVEYHMSIWCHEFHYKRNLHPQIDMAYIYLLFYMFYIYFKCFILIYITYIYIYTVYMDLIGLLFIFRNSNSFWVASCCSPPLLHQASLNSSGGSWLSRLCAAMASENLLPRLASTPP